MWEIKIRISAIGRAGRAAVEITLWPRDANASAAAA
jgi:hypothetical protein